MTHLTTTPLGATGLEISRLGVGAWAIGGPWDFGWGPQDDEDSERALHEAVEAGINWIDTAAVYGLGHSEEVVGRVVGKLSDADSPLVFTKCGMTWTEADPSPKKAANRIVEEAEASCRRLGVDRLDLLQLHWPPEDGTPVEDAWSQLLALRDRGVARFVGVSNFGVDDLERIERLGHVDTLQPPLSLLNRGALDGTLGWALDHDVGIIAYSPMQNGLLTGAWSQQRHDELADDDWRRRSDQFSGELFARNLQLVQALEPLAEELDCSLAELAIAWVLAQPGVSGAICGARKTGQVAEWAQAGEVRLDDAMLDAIRRAIETTGAGIGPIAPTDG